MWGGGTSAVPPLALIGSFVPLQIIRTFRIETRKASKAVARRKVSICGNGEGRREGSLHSSRNHFISQPSASVRPFSISQ